ncbi:MAG: type II toxin-antitoxin system ParD family antitoxin [Alphaproteobacteria bacterium]|nr:type II toxin-antitoxin system ParD family antitoxin [Alphaproteobacteria bacterium]MCY4317983.1 type II toxin-antitoxin system ParD family antitoxin [Alphaproteobacteria bacterium]
MPTRNVVLTDRQADFVTRLVDSGRYQNASEVIREGLRLVERRETLDDLRLKGMREAVDTGITDIAAGRFQAFDTTELLHDRLSALADEALGDPRSRADGDR